MTTDERKALARSIAADAFNRTAVLELLEQWEVLTEVIEHLEQYARGVDDAINADEEE